MLKLFLFGTPRCQQDGQIVHLPRRKCLALLAYLALNPQPHGREALAALLYPDSANALTYLRRTLSEIRRSLGDDLLLAENEVQLAKHGLSVDVMEFEKLVGREQLPIAQLPATNLQTAVTLYTADFMTGFTLPDAPEFDEWQFFQTESLRQTFASVLRKLIAWHAPRRQFEESISYGRRWLALDPLHEPAHRQLMQLYADAGQQAAALRQFDECARLLHEELRIAPDEETKALYESIRTRQSVSDQPSPLLSHASAPLYNFPPQTTAFIGRQKEMGEIGRLLSADPHCRLLTIVGQGGIGKTRLALEVGQQLLPAFTHGVTFVPLAPVNQADDLAGAIGTSLNIQLSGSNSPREQLLDNLRKQNLLIIADNFEHLLAGVDLLTAILQAAPQIKLLVTSRERLNVQPEWAYDLTGLAFPQQSTATASIAVQLGIYGAPALFVQRARQVRVAFRPSAQNWSAILRICQLVEGMPLGLELAASWISTMSCQEIAAGLQQGLDFLETDMRDIPERHRSIRAAIDHSWRKLDEKEQVIFAKLSVFRGGFTREAARAVAGVSLRQLARLVSKSFLKYDQISDRYQVHELMRQYGAEKLVDVEIVRTQHLDFFVAFVEKVNAGVFGPEPETWVKRMLADIDNFRTAMDWAAESGQAQAGLYLSGTLHPYWISFGKWREGRQRLERLLALPTAAEHTLARAFALEEAGNLACHMGDYETGLTFLEEGKAIGLELGEAGKLILGWIQLTHAEHLVSRDMAKSQQLYEEGTAILREVGEPWQLWLGLEGRGMLAIRQGNYAQARAVYSEQLAFVQKIGSRWLSGISMGHLGEVLYRQGDYNTARLHLEESLSILHPLGDLRHRPLGALGAIALLQGDYQQAVAYFEERLSAHRQQGSKVYILRDLSDLGIAIGHLGDYARAVALLSEALSLTQGLTSTVDIAVCLLGVAGIQRSPRRAVQLLAAAQAAFEATGEIVEPLYLAESMYIKDAASAALGEAAFVIAYAEGKAMTMEEAIANTLANSHEWADSSFNELDWRSEEVGTSEVA